MLLKKLLLVTLMTSSLVLVGCNDDDNDRYLSQNDNNQLPTTTKTYISEQAYTADALPDYAKSINVMSYNMPYVTGKTQAATALVMMPKTAKPVDGWRVVVWAHGTTGVGDSCAPSQTKIGNNFAVLAKSLLEQGYVIVAPDYEGLGIKGIHPYLNLQSEANSAIYAVEAIKEKLGKDLQGSWMSVGQSQGGHASLGIAQYAAKDQSYKGAVAAAPASSLGEIITKIAPSALAEIEKASPETAAMVYAELLSYAAYAAVGIKASSPNFDYGTMFQPRAAQIVQIAEGKTGDDGACLGDLRSYFAADIFKFLQENDKNKVTDFPAFVKNFEHSPLIAEFLTTSQPGTQQLNKPVYVVQGQLDAAVPYQITAAMVNRLNTQLGSTPQVKLDIVENAGHTEAIVEKNAEIVAFIKTHMPSL